MVIAPLAFQKNGAQPNDFLYNGVEKEENFGLDYYETMFRQYEPALGRFNTVDPMTEGLVGISPYHFSYNNPVVFSDPLGLFGDTDIYGRDRFNEDGVFITPMDREGGANCTGCFDVGGNYGVEWEEETTGTSLTLSQSTHYFKNDDGSYQYNNYFFEDGTRSYTVRKMVFKQYQSSGGIDWLQVLKDVSLYGGIQSGFLLDQSVDIALREGRGRYEGPREFLRKQTNLKSISIVTKGVSGAFTTLSVVTSFAEFATSDQSGADYARLIGAGIIIGTNFIPYAGPLISTSLAIADATGQFDSFYNGFDHATYRSMFFNSLLSGGRTTIGPFKP